GYYPCQTCLPQAHCTVSVGTLFVSCCLQIGQGLVITYVTTLFSLQAKRLPRNLACRVPEEWPLLGPSCPRPISARRGRTYLHKPGRVRLCSAPMSLLVH